MLNSRYVHLHEALGLGPMWLQAQAKILSLPTQPVAAPPYSGSLKQPETQVSAAAQTFRQPETAAVQSARLATLKHIGSSSLNNRESVSVPVVEKPPVRTVQSWLDELSGSIAPVQVMLLSMCASPADIAAGRLYSGEDGVLLHKMLQAVSLQPQQVLLTTWLKDLPDFNPKPQPETVAAAAARVAAEWQLSQAKVLLLSGNHFFAREDVMRHVHAFSGSSPVFRIPHPQQILSDPKLKRPAWETLQQMQAALAA